MYPNEVKMFRFETMAMVGLCRCYISQWDWFWDAIASLIGYDYKVAREIGWKLA